MRAARRPSALGDLLAYQLGWWTSVLGAARGAPALGPAVALGLIAWHLARRALCPRREALLLAAAALLGLGVDTALLAGGALLFPHEPSGSPWPPPWMVLLWPLFALLLERPLGWLRGRLALAALLGVIGGPLAYAGGAQLGALTLGADLPRALLLIALAWGLAAPALVALAARLRVAAPGVAARGSA